MKNLKKNKTAIKLVIWLVISAFLLVTLLPAHFHIHHEFDVDPSVHEHTVDLHLAADESVNDHHDETTNSFAATPDGTLKKSTSKVFYFLLVSLVITLLSIPRLISSRRFNLNFNIPQRFYLDSPPLRAPPLH